MAIPRLPRLPLIWAFSAGIALLSSAWMLVGSRGISAAQADGVKVHPAVLVDKLALRMLGVPATPEQKKAFVNKEKTLAQLAEEFKSDDRFALQLAQYWLQVLRIQGTMDLFGIREPGNNNPSVEDSINNKGGRARLLTVENKSENNVNYQRYVSDDAASRSCSKAELSSVHPWWNPAATVLTCPIVANEEYCGPTLAKCFPRIDNNDTFKEASNDYARDLLTGFTLEPGMIAARVIIDGRNWEDVLRTTQSTLNGPMQHFYLNWGELLLKVSPPGTFDKKDESGKLALPNPSPTNHKYQWVERSVQHAGVLTTPSFQRSFNGWRAKANVTMEAFLCQKFKIPKGAKQIPSEETDLTRRPYCQSCHSTLEPLSQFYGRWPTLGSNNYYYNPAAGVSAQGQFGGASDADTAGLARVFSARREFSECAAERAFEFMVGRPMSETESAGLLPKLTATFTGADKKVWPVMLEVLETASFKGDVP